MTRTWLTLAIGCWFGLSACAVGTSEDGGAAESSPGQSIKARTSDLTDCFGQASEAVPPDGTFLLTTFGNGQQDDGVMSCGQHTKHGSWYYAASRQRFGCGSRVKVEAKDKCVVVETDDYGPDECVETAANSPIFDASPLVANHLFGVWFAGHSDALSVRVSKVAADTPLGPCDDGSDKPPALCSAGHKKCNAEGDALEVCREDGSGYESSPCSTGSCVDGACSNPGCTPDWSCGEWNTCGCDGTRARTCTDSSQCGTTDGKPAESESCDACADAHSTCSQCVSECTWGTAGENEDYCLGVPAETWRCVHSARLDAMVSQVCRDADNDGVRTWINFNVDPRDCNACCGTYSVACKQ